MLSSFKKKYKNTKTFLLSSFPLALPASRPLKSAFFLPTTVFQKVDYIPASSSPYIPLTPQTIWPHCQMPCVAWNFWKSDNCSGLFPGNPSSVHLGLEIRNSFGFKSPEATARHGQGWEGWPEASAVWLLPWQNFFSWTSSITSCSLNPVASARGSSAGSISPDEPHSPEMVRGLPLRLCPFFLFPNKLSPLRSSTEGFFHTLSQAFTFYLGPWQRQLQAHSMDPDSKI